jgi:hypothetical protein
MPEYLAQIYAALIGAVIGSVGAVIVENLFARRREESRKREVLVQQYLYQLQDAAESLRYRLKNLEARPQPWFEQELSDYRAYLETTTLYALGRVLAVEHIFALEAVYPQLNIAYPKLRQQLIGLRIDNLQVWEDLDFYKYDRMSLAEAVIEREGEQFRPSTYLEFRRKFEAEESAEIEWLEPARHVVRNLIGQYGEGLNEEIDRVRTPLIEIVQAVAPTTGIATSSGDTTQRER